MLPPARAVLPAMALALAVPLQAQTAPVRGDVVDRASGYPIPAVEVTVYRGDSLLAAARTDDAGRFDMPAVSVGTVVVRARRLGFANHDLEVAVGATLQPLRIQLDPAPAELDSVSVEGDAGSAARLVSYRLRRDTRRVGIFMDRKDFPKNAQHLSEAFRRVPGAQLRGGTIGNNVRLRNCRPAVWVDGIKLDNTEIDDAAAIEDVAAMEVYASLTQAPPQYQDRDSRCGSVLIWLR